MEDLNSFVESLRTYTDNRTKYTQVREVVPIEDWVNDEYSSEPYSLVRSAVDMIEGEVDRIADDEEKSDDWDSMVEAITMCGLEYEFKDFGDIVDMARELDSWIMDNL
jgi:hypothetical protein